MTAQARLVYAGDSLIVVELGETIAPEVNSRAVALAAALEHAGIRGVRDVVPTYRSAAVYFDPLRTDVNALVDAIHSATLEARAPVTRDLTTRRIPVWYGGDHGPDLPEVARFAGLSEDEVVARHMQAPYRVFMLGFAPGFAYMGPVDPRIAAPRRATPRPRVAAGSVGIAGSQTGIYSMETPGGWQLIGATSVKMFDPDKPDPFALKPGDLVEFYRAGPGVGGEGPPAGAAR